MLRQAVRLIIFYVFQHMYCDVLVEGFHNVVFVNNFSHCGLRQCDKFLKILSHYKRFYYICG